MPYTLYLFQFRSNWFFFSFHSWINFIIINSTKTTVVVHFAQFCRYKDNLSATIFTLLINAYIQQLLVLVFLLSLLPFSAFCLPFFFCPSFFVIFNDCLYFISSRFLEALHSHSSCIHIANSFDHKKMKWREHMCSLRLCNIKYMPCMTLTE